MSASEHTPEPWTLVEEKRVPSVLVFTILSGTRRIASWIRSSLRQRTEDRANAQLMTSAPKLLKALEGLLVAAKWDIGCHDGVPHSYVSSGASNGCAWCLAKEFASAVVKEARGL